SRLNGVLAHALVVVALLSLGARTVIRNFVWGDPAALWQEASKLAPEDPRPHALLAEELDRSGRYEEAALEYRDALRLNPGDPLAHLKLGVCLATQRRFDEANAVFEQLRSIAPESAIVPAGLGAVALMSGEPERARTLLTGALELDPGNVMTRQWLAILE